jgi:hypothetical protein
MIRGLLHKISVEFLKTEEGNRLGVSYMELTKHQGWKVHESMLITIANAISKYMLSEEYTRLPADEKDAQQRGFHITTEIIQFLLNPLKGAEKHAAMTLHNKKMEATRKQPRGKQVEK